MKRHLTILTVLLLWTSISRGQNVSEKDSVYLMEKVDTLFGLFENPDLTSFERISTEKIHCMICFDGPDLRDEPYMLNRIEFYEKHLNRLKQFDSFIRAKRSKDIMFVRENGQVADVTVFFTIYQKDELAPGHEVGQFGISFKKANGEFKFAGMETVP